MSEIDISPADVYVLLVLMSEGRDVSNPELKERYGVTLDGRQRVRLNDRKLVESWPEGRYRAYSHRLSESGATLLLDVLSWGVPRPDRSGWSGAALASVAGGVQRYLHTSGNTLHDLFAPRPEGDDLEAAIRDAYGRLAERPGAWVRLVTLRAALGDVPAGEVDAALTRMIGQPDVNLVPESNQKTLTPEDRAAAARIGDQDKHFLRIEA